MNPFFFVSAFFAEVAGTISGFGSSSILLPFAHQFFDYRNAIVLIALYHIFWNISRLSFTYWSWDKRIFFLFGIPSVIATYIGASLVETVHPSLLKIILGIFLSLFALYALWKPTLRVNASPLVARIGGAISGFTAGLIGTWGVLRGAFMTIFWLEKERYIATIASIALLVDITRIPVYFGQWFLSRKNYVYIPILFLIAWIGSYIWKRIVNRMTSWLLRRIILIAIILLSLWLIVQWVKSM